MNKETILEWILVERNRQDVIHPFFPSKDFEKLSILLEEVGEVAKALNEKDEENLKEELIQVAAVCMRWLESEWYF